MVTDKPISDTSFIVHDVFESGAGMSVKDYDDKVIAIARAYFNEKLKLYLALNRNCNTTTSTIVRRSVDMWYPQRLCGDYLDGKSGKIFKG